MKHEKHYNTSICQIEAFANPHTQNLAQNYVPTTDITHRPAIFTDILIYRKTVNLLLIFR